MARAKRRARGHVVDEAAQGLLRARIPPSWVIRHLSPDYGIDCDIEVFDETLEGSFETLGEHLLVQLKGTRKTHAKSLLLRSRFNIELVQPIDYLGDDFPPLRIEAIPLRVETTLLTTVQRMGSALPVLLILADTDSQRLYFLCLNDYVEKILLPEDPNYAARATKTLHIPCQNQIPLPNGSLIPLYLYAKRPKLYAAFQKFAYQYHQFQFTHPALVREQAQYFANIILQYDFWQSCSWWEPIALAHSQLLDLLQTGSTSAGRWSMSSVPEGLRRSLQDLARHDRSTSDIFFLWGRLANLGRIFEEICREWFLPTYLGQITSSEAA